MARIDEIAPDVFRLSILHPDVGMQFNHFLVRDDEPLLMHAGLRQMFAELHEAVGTLIDPAKLRWIASSHFESDECGGLNDWLAGAPNASSLCGFASGVVNLSDFAVRTPRMLQDGETLETGSKRFRFLSTAQLPHGWDAGVFYEETDGALYCSDLCHQAGDPPPVTEDEILTATRTAIEGLESTGALANYMPLTPRTRAMLERLAALEPRLLATMHGSSYRGDCAAALRGFGDLLEDLYGGKTG